MSFLIPSDEPDLGRQHGRTKKIILLSGPVSSGKSKLAKALEEEFGLQILRTRDVLIRSITSQNPSALTDRLSLQVEGDRLDEETQGKWVLSELLELLKPPSDRTTVIDSVRINNQIDHIRNAFPLAVAHVHLTAPLEERRKRYERKYRGVDDPSYDKVRENKTEASIEDLAKVADVAINTNQCSEGDVTVRAASYMSLYGDRDSGYVDVVIGAQYGSEGKGQIAAYISREYDLLVRVGGPNAGHTVYEDPDPYTHHHLPSGTRRSSAKLLLGPGMTIRVDKLLEEIRDCDVDVDRLKIDPNAIIITDEDVEQEKEVEKMIGSTRRGVGEATARKIRDRGKKASSNDKLLLAGDIPDLKPWIRSAERVLSEAFAKNQRVLLEGTQGTGLSLHHGYYPHVTSRDTTVAGCLAEAGIAPSRVRRVLMVCRSYPIRVENPPGASSGPMSAEITWKDISQRSGIELKDLEKTEKTSTTHRRRRVGEFDWVLLRKAALLNGPTDIALTFVDYLTIDNRKARRFEQLSKETIDLIEEIERVTHARVSLVSTGFNWRSTIDRRSW
jgi:adenylosuccinate synthase